LFSKKIVTFSPVFTGISPVFAGILPVGHMIPTGPFPAGPDRYTIFQPVPALLSTGCPLTATFQLCRMSVKKIFNLRKD
jgi:hypothetical protein